MITKIMYIKNAVLLFSLIFCFNLEISAQSDHSKLNLVNDLKQFFSYHTFENAYLQFDKPYYAAGDTIYFKAYVTEGEQHQLSDVSGVLHVDLINPENKINQSIELGLDSGLTWGDFALPESLPAGNYRIRAYTQLMRNYGEMGFFDRIIPVGSLKYVNTHESVVNQPRQLIKNNPDFQFFPEGGNLVTDVRTKVGVKAIDTTGLGININGEILDNNNKEVCSFSTTHLGMGYFFLKPDGDKTYHAKVAFADGTQKIIDLP
ncbi:MAG TPA: MG2 domain-containing protein, partial [Hanamia sp.]